MHFTYRYILTTNLGICKCRAETYPVVMIHLLVLRHLQPSVMLKDILNTYLSNCSYFLRQPTLFSAMASEMAQSILFRLMIPF